ncbi:hypothetical protein HGA92_00115 [Candidatus Gracilibacteria bacterium]|nr:hypothetical protein [Candidatus Gracilibacteria bacterium]NUJ98984.1 hypothetical protein [Candidatus Gracilibacteria bacterium]
MDYKINELKIYLVSLKHNLVGDFLKNNSSYDGDICKVLFMEENTGRYWDAKWEGLNIEFKKGKSVWLDLIRYSEVVVGIDNSSRQKTFTLFFIPNKEKDKIIEIIGVNTERIIDKLGLDISIAKIFIELNKKMPRSLNAQASLTIKDIREIADFII